MSAGSIGYAMLGIGALVAAVAFCVTLIVVIVGAWRDGERGVSATAAVVLWFLIAVTLAAFGGPKP